MPDLTSLKVSRSARDRLAKAAKVRGISVRALLDELSRAAEDAAEMEAVSQQMAVLRDDDPKAWAQYVADGRSWEERTVDRLDA